MTPATNFRTPAPLLGYETAPLAPETTGQKVGGSTNEGAGMATSRNNHRVRIAAARLRVTIASRRGEDVPEWVAKLAAEPLHPGDKPWQLNPDLVKQKWWRFK
jgi:hypothetical protein